MRARARVCVCVHVHVCVCDEYWYGMFETMGWDAKPAYMYIVHVECSWGGWRRRNHMLFYKPNIAAVM